MLFFISLYCIMFALLNKWVHNIICNCLYESYILGLILKDNVKNFYKRGWLLVLWKYFLKWEFLQLRYKYLLCNDKQSIDDSLVVENSFRTINSINNLSDIIDFVKHISLCYNIDEIARMRLQISKYLLIFLFVLHNEMRDYQFYIFQTVYFSRKVKYTSNYCILRSQYLLLLKAVNFNNHLMKCLASLVELRLQ